MPIEIRELHIKVTVNQPQADGEGGAVAQNGSSTEKTDKELLIQQCVEQVLDIINNKTER